MLKFGVLGGADIAKRIFIPSLIKSENAKCIAVASNNNKKGNSLRMNLMLR